MSVVVNLYADRMSDIRPAHAADLAPLIGSALYRRAAAKMGLTPQQYAAFRQALNRHAASYVQLPRHLDAMAGRHRNGMAYALHNVVVPRHTMGWRITLADGTAVYVPQQCANLAVLHSSRNKVKRQRHAVRAAHYLNGGSFGPETLVSLAPATLGNGAPIAIAHGSLASSGGGAAGASGAGSGGGGGGQAGWFAAFAPLFARLFDHPGGGGGGGAGGCRP